MGFLKGAHLPLGAAFNKKLLFTAAILATSQFNFGYEGSAFTDIQAMDAFIQDFGTVGPDGTKTLKTQWLSFFNGFSIVGFAVGLIIGNQMTDRLGRRWTVRLMCIWTILCTTIVITSRNANQMMAGRALNYLYIGMELAVIPLYQAEITPTSARGAMVATYNTALTVGSLVASLIDRGTSTIPGKASYLIPIGLFYIVPVIVLVGALFIPESPRWLVLHDRHEEALASLRLLRDGKFTEEQIEDELVSIQAACATFNQTNAADKGNFWIRWRKIWSAKHIKRTGIVLGTNFFLHGTGNAFAGMYGTIFFKSLGTVNPFSLSVIRSCLLLVCSVASLVLVDSVGRRPLLLGGSFVQAAALLAMGGLGMATVKTFAINSGVVATMMIFVGAYTVAWGQLSHTITSEIPSAEVRDVTYATGSLLAISTQAAMTFGLPYLLNAPYAALGSKVGFIFGSLAAVSFIFAFFCVPETSGKSLEEIDILLSNKIAVRHFKHAKIDNPATKDDMKEPKMEITMVEDQKHTV